MKRVLFSVLLLSLTLVTFAPAADAEGVHLLAMQDEVIRFEILICRTGPATASATLLQPGGEPMCGPVPVVPIPDQGVALMICEIGPRPVAVAVVSNGVELFWIAFSGGRSASGLLMIVPEE